MHVTHTNETPNLDPEAAARVAREARKRRGLEALLRALAELADDELEAGRLEAIRARLFPGEAT